MTDRAVGTALVRQGWYICDLLMHGSITVDEAGKLMYRTARALRELGMKSDRHHLYERLSATVLAYNHESNLALRRFRLKQERKNV